MGASASEDVYLPIHFTLVSSDFQTGDQGKNLSLF